MSTRHVHVIKVHGFQYPKTRAQLIVGLRSIGITTYTAAVPTNSPDEKQPKEALGILDLIGRETVRSDCNRHRRLLEGFLKSLTEDARRLGVCGNEVVFVPDIFKWDDHHVNKIPNDRFFARELRNSSSLQYGECIHARTIRVGYEKSIFVSGALVDMYARCGTLEDARQVFDKIPERNVVLWTSMILEYAQRGHEKEALELFFQMQQESVKTDEFIFTSVLSVCASIGILDLGKQLHGHVVRAGFESCVCVGSALVNMYVKSGELEEARQVFDKMPKRNVVSWTAMIAGYAQHGNGEECLRLFLGMQKIDMKPNEFTFVSVLRACGGLVTLEKGKRVHGHIISAGFELYIYVGNALVTMYAKCGGIEDARHVFDKMSVRDVISWNAMIAGYAQHGHGEEALQLVEQMQEVGMKPDHITFIGVLSACRHAGLVDEGRQYFNAMRQDYGIVPSFDHYACMVDLLGRAGHLDEAEDFIKKMPFEPNGIVWGALLAACKIHGNIQLGEWAADCRLQLEPECASTHVLLASIYAADGRWDDVAYVRKMMKDKGLRTQPGYSWIEIKGKVYAFGVEDRSHPQTKEIFAVLNKLAGQLREAGYVPDTNFVLHDVEKERKAQILCEHSEKLAIAFGLLSTAPETPIRISKNLRVCGDCHTATKFISQIVGREIVVRDASRFHHFKDGLCSCGDYW